MKPEFERRAAEMKARNLARGRPPIATLPRPSIFAPPKPITPPTKVYIRDFLRDADIDKLSAPLAAIKKLTKVETDRDGLLDFSGMEFQIAVSPDLFVRAIKTYDAVLKEALSRGWITKTDDSARWQITVSTVQLRLAVTEKIEPIPGMLAPPGGRRPRRPTGSLVVSLTAGYQQTATISDKRGTQIESKLPSLFLRAEALAAEVHAKNEKDAARQREWEMEARRRREIEQRIERVNREVVEWERAEKIRGYVRAMTDHLSAGGPIDSESHAAKWLKWASNHADNVDPTRRPFNIEPQEFWEWDFVRPVD